MERNGKYDLTQGGMGLRGIWVGVTLGAMARGIWIFLWFVRDFVLKGMRGSSETPELPGEGLEEVRT